MTEAEFEADTYRSSGGSGDPPLHYLSGRRDTRRGQPAKWMKIGLQFMSMLPRVSIHVKGTTGLIVAAVIIAVVLISFPAYRVFFAISLGIGIVVAAILYLRNKYRPITDKDVENKRPLGLG